MGFFDLFKPKWRHSDAEIRVEAVRQLGPGDAAILVQIVKKDQDARVRRLAVKKLDDPEVLLDIARSDSDETLRRAAQEKAEDLLQGELLETDDLAAAQAAAARLGQKALAGAARRAKSAAVRQLAAELVSDDRLLGELVRTSDDAELRASCLARITSETALRDVALGAPTRELALLALERVSDPALLKDIGERGKGKALRGAALARLEGAAGAEAAAGAAAQPGGKAGKPGKAGPNGKAAAGKGRRTSPAEAALEKRRRAEMLALIQKAETLLRGADLAHIAGELEGVQHAFDNLVEAEDAPLRQRMDKVAAEVRARQAVEARRAALSQQLVESARRDKERCERRAALTARVDKLDGDGLPAQLLEARAAFAELGPPESEAERDAAARFAGAVKEALRRHEGADSRRAARGRLEEIVADAEALGAGAGSQGGLPDVHRHRRLREIERRFQELAGTLVPGDELRARWDAAFATLRRADEEARAQRQREAEEVRAKLVSFAERLEALVESTERKAQGAMLKDVGFAMKQIGALPPGERDPMGERLRAARDRLVSRMQELREEEDWKRWANVPHAEALCVHIEALRERLRAQRAEAAASGEAAPAEEAAAVEAEGQVAAAEEADEEAQVAAAEEVDEEAQVAPGAEAPEATGLEAAAGETSEGHGAGSEPRPEGSAEGAGRSLPLAVHHEHSGQGEAGPEGAPAATGDGAAPPPRGQRRRRTAHLGPMALQRELQAARAAWKALGPLPKGQSEVLWARFKAVVDELSGQLREHQAAAAEQHGENLKQKEALCQGAEALADSSDWKEAGARLKAMQTEWKAVGPVPTKAQSDELWRRFRAACDRFFERRKEHDAEADKDRAQNAVRLQALCQRAEALAESTDWKDAAEDLKRLQAEWKEVGPAPKADSEALWKRFRTACDRFFERRKAQFEKLDAERGENLKAKDALCLEVEQLFDSEEMGEQEAQEAVRDYMARWKAVGPVPKEQSEPLWERFRTACDRLLLRQWLPPDLEPARFENRAFSGLAGLADLAGKPGAPEPDKSGEGS